MKRALTIVAIMMAVVANGSLVNAQGIEGGVIDTKDRSITVLEDIGNEHSILIGVSPYVSEQKEMGKLIVVDPYGRAKEVEKRFVDKQKVLISVPKNSINKVVFLDRYGKIVGGTGLSKDDAISLIFRNKETFGKVYSSYSSLVSLSEDDNLFDAIKSGVEAFDSDHSEEDQEKLFRSAIYMMAGKDAVNLVNKIILASGEMEQVDGLSRSAEFLSPVAKGISIVCYGDNGGFGECDPQAYGDNGGFGKTDLVAYGDNGGFGREVIVEGWAASPNLPDLPDIDLNLGGITLMLSQ